MLFLTFVCATVLDMVFDRRFPDATTKNVNEDTEDDCSSVSTSKEDVDDDVDEKEETGAVVLADKENIPNFGNICVTNSSEVHFGNKTVYQGPVTIKQVLYTNGGFESDVNNVNNGNLAINEISDIVTDSVTNNSPNNVKSSIKDSACAKRYSKLAKVIEWIKKHLVVFATLLVLVIVAISAIVIVVVTKVYISGDVQLGNVQLDNVQESPELDTADLTIPHLDPNRTVTLSGKLKIIERREWLAQPPSEEPTPLKLPVPYVIIMHTASEGCFNQGDCTLSVRLLQSFHIDGRKWWDIGYNFMVGGDGYVYEGRGWKKEGAHTYGYNARSIGIAFIGTFNNELPRPDQMKACQLLIQKGVNLGYIQTNYTLFAATQLSQTQSPGTKLYQELTKWPHFALKPTK